MIHLHLKLVGHSLPKKVVGHKPPKGSRHEIKNEIVGRFSTERVRNDQTPRHLRGTCKLGVLFYLPVEKGVKLVYLSLESVPLG